MDDHQREMWSENRLEQLEIALGNYQAQCTPVNDIFVVIAASVTEVLYVLDTVSESFQRLV